MSPEILENMRDLATQGRVREALDLIDNENADTHILNLKSRLNTFERKKIQGTISNEQANLELNNITSSLFLWLNNDTEALEAIKPEEIKVDASLIQLVKEKLRKSLNFYYLATALPILAGIGLGIFFFKDMHLTALEGLGAALIASISGLSVREILNRKDKISFLDIVLVRSGDLTDSAELQKLYNLSWSIIESTILRS